MASTRPFKAQREPMSKALMLALGIHVLLLIALALSTRWKSSAPAAIEAELWNATPQVASLSRPPPPPPPLVQPKPEPQPKPVEKTPDEPKPDIAIEAKRKEAERKKQDELKQVQEDKDKRLKEELLKQDKLEKDKLAKEKKAQEALDKKLLDEVRRDNEQRLARATQGNAANTASPNQRSLGTAGAGSRFSLVATGKVKDNLNFPEGDYKPATVMVSLAPDGTVLDVKFTKPSGNPAQDAAIERAIRRTARFPPENPGEAYRQVELEFRASN
jgi:colicin import membrane protein